MKIPRGLSGRSIVLLLFIFNLGLAKTYEDPDYYSTNDSYESIEDSAESNNNKIDTPPKPTYISAIEWLLMTLSSPFRGLMQNSAKREENQRAIGRFLSVVPNPIKTILQPNHVKRRQTFGDVLNRFTDRFKAVYPGTYWCGNGAVAKDAKELGIFESTDRCCRAHDLCPENIDSGTERQGLLNNGMFTRSHCNCDEAFYKCLKDGKNLISSKIGYTYFNILRPQCFKVDYPIKACNKYGRGIFNRKCLEYQLDSTGNKTMQWFDNKDY